MMKLRTTFWDLMGANIFQDLGCKKSTLMTETYLELNSR